MKTTTYDNGFRKSVCRFCIGLLLIYALCATVFALVAGNVVFFRADGTQSVFGAYFLPIVLGIGAFLLLLCVYLLFCAYRNKPSRLFYPLNILRRYGFLINQLVRRDFKTKYKRSVLGVLWSFLNPLLMMVVQYVVFSQVFSNAGIKNYPVYLLTGIVLFNFFSESSNMGLVAIVNNASLITKVYVPKYIYPLSRTLSSLINLGFALIPLFLVVLISSVPFSWALVLLIFDLFCLTLFCLGVSLFLSALMVFFRDIQFLWGVILTIWTYLTPIFYHVDIIPARYQTIYKLNPMYHFVTFARTVIIDGESPALLSYAICFGAALLALLFGSFVFASSASVPLTLTEPTPSSPKRLLLVQASIARTPCPLRTKGQPVSSALPTVRLMPEEIASALPPP
jgi:ABC-2 type transport system permease protein